MIRVTNTLVNRMVRAIVYQVNPEQVDPLRRPRYCGGGRCSMSDLNCPRVLFLAAERDLLTLRGMTAATPEGYRADRSRGCGPRRVTQEGWQQLREVEA